ncbi:BsuPI-related putative proteinase inhibitor [Aneurinibacillus sp. REN35]|uniref:BsuPI-related putative proteinase inhibitor n=1 Tax=Aneurinibacillus sp. REN35 TaxID=3237286 RepID=UPI003528602C
MKNVNIKSVAIGVVLGSVMTAGVGYGASSLTQVAVDLTPVTIKVGEESKSGTYHNGKENLPLTMMYKDTTYVPIRFISEALGQEATWAPQSRTVTIAAKDKDGIWEGKVESKLAYKEGTLLFTVKNQTEREQTLQFNTGQKYDYIIWNEKGEKVRQDSEGKQFTEVISKESLKQGEEKTYTADLAPLAKGTYKVEFWLTAKGTDIKNTATIHVAEDLPAP